MEDGGDFGGRHVVVTGAASGIGLAAARRFAALGARVAMLDVAESELRALGAELGDRHLALTCDVRDTAAIERAFAAIAESFGALDVLVNNAGINPGIGSSLEVDDAFYDRVMGVNVRGLFFCAREAMRRMVPAGSGVIVNLGSVSGMIGWGGSSIYSASKGAVIALTKFLAVELAPRGVRVNAVCPGSIRTPMVERNFAARPDPEEAWRETAKVHPLGRVGTADEVADAIVYLASPRSSFVTGTCLVVDGGLTAV